MKEFLITFITLFVVSALRANPLPSTQVNLSEIYFDSNGQWTIELQYFDARQNYFPIDTIWIATKSGISQLRRFDITGTTGLLIVRNDSLLSPLSLDPLNDSIRVIYTIKLNANSYYKTSSYPIVYGNSETSSLGSPKNGQSIAEVPSCFYDKYAEITGISYNGIFSIDKSATIGMVNDTTGMCGTLKGHIYDKYNQLISDTAICFFNEEAGIYFHPEPGGFYSVRTLSRKSQVDNLYFCTSGGTSFRSMKITPINVSMQPDSVISMDIHLLDDLLNGTSKIYGSSGFIFKILPNPAKDLVLNYQIGIPVSSTHCYIVLYNLNGEEICNFSVMQSQGKLNLPPAIKNGVYILKLYANNKNYSSLKVIISR